MACIHSNMPCDSRIITTLRNALLSLLDTSLIRWSLEYTKGSATRPSTLRTRIAVPITMEVDRNVESSSSCRGSAPRPRNLDHVAGAWPGIMATFWGSSRTARAGAGALCYRFPRGLPVTRRASAHRSAAGVAGRVAIPCSMMPQDVLETPILGPPRPRHREAGPSAG